MGMFDWVKCRYPLPNPDHNKLSFQTKDLENYLTEFVILEDGRVAIRCVTSEWVHDETRAIIKGYLKVKSKWWEHYPVHGIFNMYATDPKTKEWVEYSVKCANGLVESISVYTPEDAKLPTSYGERIEQYWEDDSPWGNEDDEPNDEENSSN